VTAMTTYLDVGVARIQTWLARSSDLRGRRGASNMLTRATSERQWAGFPPQHPAWMPDGAHWNQEAGDVDGVVNLVIDDDVDPATVAREVVKRLRMELPSVTLEASWARAADYATAYGEMRRQRDEGGGIISLPLVAELSVARPCEKCRQDPAVKEILIVADERAWVCLDCERRYDKAGTMSRPPDSLARALADVADPPPRLPENMRELARVGEMKRGPETFRAGAAKGEPESTRVALIYADGDNVGTLHAVAADYPEVGNNEIAAAIDTATRVAFAAAADWTRVDGANGNREVGLIPHIVGGDDLVVSVAARFAWRFLITYLNKFRETMSAQAAAWPMDLQSISPTVSAGIVFHHNTHPLSDAIQLAESAMDVAKAKHGWTFVYLDLDQDDPAGALDGRGARDAEWFAANEWRIKKLLDGPRSARMTVSRYARTGTSSDRALLRSTVTKLDLSELKDALDDLDEIRWLLQVANDHQATKEATDGE